MSWFTPHVDIRRRQPVRIENYSKKDFTDAAVERVVIDVVHPHPPRPAIDGSKLRIYSVAARPRKPKQHKKKNGGNK